ncbi:MAG: NfeD family protein [Cytophagales bacterium]|nr:hypothetical protein [Bernardetiaceae bacterium]MDW8209856.1 NfeD family protein [Cytophagales bacterium]
MPSNNLLYEMALFCAQPWMSALLILLFITGIILEIKLPGTIVPLAVGLLSAIIYFITYSLLGLAAWWEVLMFFAGTILMVIEIFALPGLGTVGIIGIILTIISLVLAALPNHITNSSQMQTADAISSLLIVIAGIVGGIVVLTYLIKKIVNSRLFHQVTLHQSLDASEGFALGTQLQSLIGKPALVRTVLRPSGKVEIEGKLYEATSLDSYIEAGKWVYVVDVEGNMLRVRPREDFNPNAAITKA